VLAFDFTGTDGVVNQRIYLDVQIHVPKCRFGTAQQPALKQAHGIQRGAKRRLIPEKMGPIGLFPDRHEPNIPSNQISL